MVDPSPDLQAAALLARLGTERFGRHYEPVAECHSTNDLCALRARQGAPEGLLVLAEHQTGGRGRQGRVWASAAGQNLTFSLLLRPERSAAALPPLTLVVGAAIAEVLADALAARGLTPRVKWPNDVVVDRPEGPHKLCGVLTEMATERERVRHVVVGVGLNVNQEHFPPELAGRATSLRLLLGAPQERGAWLAALLAGLEAAYDRALRDGGAASLAHWRRRAGLPRPATVDRAGERLSGLAVDVDPDGALLLEAPSGIRQRIVSGEVS